MQSAYRPYHSTETAVLKIMSDILYVADRGDVTFLCLLDLSAALDTIEHDILVERLEKAFGLRGQVLEWIKSCLCRMTQTVTLKWKHLTQYELQSCVPQGSVLGPILFLLYTADVIEITTRYVLSAHSYTENTKLKFHEKAHQCLKGLPSLKVCVGEIDEWMSSNRLKLNN